MTLAFSEIVRFVGRTSDPLSLAGAFLAASFLVKRLAFPRRPAVRFLCQILAFAGFTVTLYIAGVTPVEPSPKTSVGLRLFLADAFKIAWWFTGAWLLVGFFRAIVFFEHQPAETRLLQDVFAGIVYTCAVLGVVAYVFDIPVSGLLAASGVIAIVLGLALQSTLGDVFSGVVLNLAKPYRVGDWIILEGGLQGRVLEANWRATQMQTISNDLAIVPNSIVAKARIINASAPIAAHGLTIIVRIEPSVAPSNARRVLETALLSCNRIARTPASVVVIRALDAAALECELRFFVTNVDDSEDAQSELFDLVYRHCRAAGLRLAPPPNASFVLPPPPVRPDIKEPPQRLLDHLPIFASLSEDERSALAPKLKRRMYKPGDVIIATGTVTQALFILASGVVAALETLGDTEGEVVRLSPGDIFGEAGLLSDAATPFKVVALTRAAVYEIAKADLADLLEGNPAIASELAQVLARRQTIGEDRRKQEANRHEGNEHVVSRLTGRLKQLLGIE